MTLVDAILRVYPQANPFGGDYGTSDDGLQITNWNTAKLGAKPREVDVLAKASTLPLTTQEKLEAEQLATKSLADDVRTKDRDLTPDEIQAVLKRLIAKGVV